MKLPTLKSKLKLYNVNSNAKTSKGDTDSDLTAIMYLASGDTSGYEVCKHASPQCRQMCLYSAGRGRFSNVQNARIKRTKLFFEDKDKFLKDLYEETSIFKEYCEEHQLNGNVRLNGTSDINFINLIIKDDKDIFQLFPELNFYDYTKDYSRTSSYNNYYILYSRTETTPIETIRDLTNKNKNVAVVFDEVPVKWKGIKVIDGDKSDLRLKDESGVIVGLKAKGMAKKSKREQSGFVIEASDL